MPWIKVTEPSKARAYINTEQIARVKPDTQVPGANCQIDIASGAFQGVVETVDEVMQLITGSTPTGA